MCRRHHHPLYLPPTSSFQNTNKFPSFLPFLRVVVAVNVAEAETFKQTRRILQFMLLWWTTAVVPSITLGCSPCLAGATTLWSSTGPGIESNEPPTCTWWKKTGTCRRQITSAQVPGLGCDDWPPRKTSFSCLQFQEFKTSSSFSDSYM